MNENTSHSGQFSAMTKKELYHVYKVFGFRTVRLEMNQVIADLRGVSLKEAKDNKVLRPKEVEELERRLK